MKRLTVVFPIFEDEVLMGKQASGKKMPGIRNGYGGKCEDGESLEDCAVRELGEEIGLEIASKDLHYFGRVIEGDKVVYFYVVKLSKKIRPEDNTEMVDNRWFKITDYETYVPEMLPGCLIQMENMHHFLSHNEGYIPFELDFSENKLLMEITKNIYR
jgi:8-oxo-dGTP pyrophosphatase MutT (NUDIX family)